MFNLVGSELPRTTKEVPRVFTKFAGRDTGHPMFQLKDEDGKLSYLCIESACQSPFNKCCRTPCENNPTRSRNRFPYLHVDLADDRWKEAPEETFAPIVEFLKLPGVHEVIRPSKYSKALTPSANW